MLEPITKIDAARRRLATAITLFFDAGASVSIHTLTSAAQEILRDLGRPRGIGSMLKDSRYIRADKQKEVHEFLRAAQNFFKHADKDPEAVHDFRPAVNPFYILDSIELYTQLVGAHFPEAEVFLLWFAIKHPDVTSGELRELALNARRLGIDPENLQTVGAALKIFKTERIGF